MRKKILLLILAICFVLPCAMLCTACGGHTHNFATQYSSSETHHWFECLGADCDEKTGYEQHDWDEGQEISAPTCTEDGQTKYTCKVCSKTRYESIPAGHSFGETTYSWSADNTNCTATRECTNCEHKEQETVHSHSQVVQEQSCVNVELTTYTAIFENSAFATQTKENIQTKDIDVSKHSFGAVSYVWSADNSICTATRVCLHNGEHIEEENATITPQISQAQTCEQVELTTYVATFVNTAFATQTKENIQTKDAFGHSFGAVSYDWSTDNTNCTATRECTNCEHEEQETVYSHSQVVQEQSCVNVELTTYTATFENPVFATQTKENVQTKDAFGHDFENGTYITTSDTHHWKKCSRCDAEETDKQQAHDFSGEWVTDGAHHWKECETCGKIQQKFAHNFNQEIQDEKHLKVVATCENQGEYYHSCSCGAIGTTTFTTPVLPHSYEDGACSHCGATEGLVFGSSGGINGYTGTATDVVIPKYSDTGCLNKSINLNAFAYKTNIVSVTLPDSITTIDNLAFKGCTSLQFINLNNVTTLNSSAFNGCSSLNNVSIGNVTLLGQNVFEGCSSLTSITFSHSLQTINSSCFWGCSSLRNIDFGSGVTTIGNYAFKNCTALETVVIPNNVTTLNLNVFGGCTTLVNVTLPQNLTGIMDSVFNGCTSLVTIKIPAGVTSIGYECFASCSKLQTVIFEENSVLETIGYSAFSRTDLTSISLPSTVTSIGNQAFYRCFGLTSVDLGNGVQEIEQEAFSNCGIKTITIPVSLTAIPQSMLSSNGDLTTIKYTGTEAQWNALTKGGNWDYSTGAYVVMCSDSDENGLAKQTYVNVFFYMEPYDDYCSFAVLPNQTVVEPAEPTKNGFTFGGWYQSADYGTTLEETPFDFTTPITSDTFIYAKWLQVD